MTEWWYHDILPEWQVAIGNWQVDDHWMAKLNAYEVVNHTPGTYRVGSILSLSPENSSRCGVRDTRQEIATFRDFHLRDMRGLNIDTVCISEVWSLKFREVWTLNYNRLATNQRLADLHECCRSFYSKTTQYDSKSKANLEDPRTTKWAYQFGIVRRSHLHLFTRGKFKYFAHLSRRSGLVRALNW